MLGWGRPTHFATMHLRAQITLPAPRRSHHHCGLFDCAPRSDLAIAKIELISCVGVPPAAVFAQSKTPAVDFTAARKCKSPICLRVVVFGRRLTYS